MRIFQDSNGRVWAGAAHPQWRNDGGLTLFKNNSIDKVYNETDGLTYKSITSIDQDINGNLLKEVMEDLLFIIMTPLKHLMLKMVSLLVM